MKNEVLEFINRRFKTDCKWCTGNCYYFAIILHTRFNNGDIIYEPVMGHFLYKIEEYCYDFKGKHELPNFYYIWKELEGAEPSLYKRIVIDCTL